MATSKEERIIEIIVNGQKASANLKEMTGAANALSAQLRTLAPGTAEFVEKSKQLQEVRSRITSVKESITGVTREQTLMSEGFQRMLGAVAPLELLFKAIEFGKEGLNSFREAEQAQAALAAKLKSTAGAAGMTIEALNDLAAAQQHKTLFDDDTVKGAEKILLSFTGIHKGVYEQAIPAIQDLATTMAGDGDVDLVGTANLVGKALNDPIEGLSKLTKIGVTFSASQKDTIKALMEAGDVAGAQSIMLAELNKEFGGSAEAARKAAGAQGDFKDTMMDLSEAVGSLVADGLNLLYPLVLQLVTGFLALANGVRTLPEFVKENKELFIALGVAIVSLNTANIAAAASTLYMTAVEKGRSVATRASAAAQWLLNAAMDANPIGLLIAAVALLVGGFVKLYNSSQTVRASLAGVGAAAVAFFESLVKTAMQSLGGLADLIAGVFTFDLAQIKRGAAALKDSFRTVGKDTAAAFHAGYQGKIEEEAAAAAAARQAAGKKKVNEAGAQGAIEGEAENSAQRKARAKREKEAAAAAKKHRAELEKTRKEFHAAMLKADQEYEKLRVEAMADGIEKTLAKLKLERDEELRGLEEKKKAVLANVAATEKDKQHLLDQYREIARMAEARYQQNVKEAKEKQAEKDRKDEFARLDGEEEEKLVVLDNGWLEQKLHLRKQTVEYLKAEQARADAELRLRRVTAAAKLAIMKKEGKDETAEAKKLKNTILKIDGELAEGQAESDKRLTETERQEANERKQNQLDLAGAKIEIGATVLDSVLDNLDQEGSAYEVFNAARKALALAEIAINLEKQLSNNAVTASLIDTTTFGVGGSVWLAVKDTLAVVQAGAAAAKVAGFASGGFTGTGVGQVDTSGHRVAGVVHDNEWVAPKWMLQKPKYANLIGYLEAERRGSYAVGGYTSAGSLPPSAAGGSQASDATTAAIMQLTQAVAAQNERMNSWAENLGVNYYAGNAAQAMSLRIQLRSQASLRKSAK